MGSWFSEQENEKTQQNRLFVIRHSDPRPNPCILIDEHGRSRMTPRTKLMIGPKDTPGRPENGQGSDQHWRKPERDHRDPKKSTLLHG
jgi:hypothetical protein